MDPKSLKKAKLANKGLQLRMVGKLIYISHNRHDTKYAIEAVSKFIPLPQV